MNDLITSCCFLTLPHTRTLKMLNVPHPPLRMLGLIFQPGQKTEHQAVKGWHQATPQRQEVLLQDDQQVWPDGHGGIAEEGKEAAAVDQEVQEESLTAYAIKDGGVDMQGLHVDARRKVWVQALGESLTHSQL